MHTLYYFQLYANSAYCILKIGVFDISLTAVLRSIIFDEIDTGVSGDIAQKMAGILQRMGNSMQVIAITHLPQIAGKGNSHFKIFKEDSANATTTKIEELKDSERVEELAMMLGGKNIGESARAHARALLD